MSKKSIELSEEDRMEVLTTLHELSNEFAEAALDCQPHARLLRARLRKRAERLAQLAALFAVLLFGCAQEQPPPPYRVFFASDVPAEDRDVWRAAASDWNDAVGGAPVLIATDESYGGRCGIEVVRVEHWDGASPAWSLNASGACLMRIYYARGSVEACIALHELGHRLLDEHVPRTVMDQYGCDYEAVVTSALARRVRERWGL